MTEDEKENTTKIYRIPEIREPTLFDYIVQNIVPEIFRFTEYVTFTGFILYLAIKTESSVLYAFSILLYGCVYWYVMDKQISLVKRLQFRNVWVMRVTSWLLLIGGVVVLIYVQSLVLHIASAQYGNK